MIVEARQAFYSEETGAVSPWRDIEVTDTVGEGLIGSGLAVEVSAGGGGGGDFSTEQVTFEIGSGVGAFEYMAQVDYPQLNPGTSSQQQYATYDVIGNTQDPKPVPEIDSTQAVNVLTYNGIAYISQYFSLYSYNSYDQIDVSGYTLSGAAETVEDGQSVYYGMIRVTGECTITLIRE